MALYRDQGVVLRTYKLGEADRIVVMNDYRVQGEITNTRRYDAMSERIMALIQGEVAVRPGDSSSDAAGLHP